MSKAGRRSDQTTRACVRGSGGGRGQCVVCARACERETVGGRARERGREVETGREREGKRERGKEGERERGKEGGGGESARACVRESGLPVSSWSHTHTHTRTHTHTHNTHTHTHTHTHTLSSPAGSQRVERAYRTVSLGRVGRFRYRPGKVLLNAQKMEFNCVKH